MERRLSFDQQSKFCQLGKLLADAPPITLPHALCAQGSLYDIGPSWNDPWALIIAQGCHWCFNPGMSEPWPWWNMWWGYHSYGQPRPFAQQPVFRTRTSDSIHRSEAWFDIMRAMIWSFVIALLVVSVDAISLLSIKGNKFFDATGEQFFIKGSSRVFCCWS